MPQRTRAFHGWLSIAARGQRQPLDARQRRGALRRDNAAVTVGGQGMEEGSVSGQQQPVRQEPVVRRISRQDVVEALAAGLRDFQARPLYGLAFGLFYALGGLLIAACLSVLDASYLIYPLIVGFAMLGPFVASGLYEVSRRRETGAPLSFPVVLTAIWDQRRKELSWMAFVALFFVIIWLYQVRLLLALFLGFRGFGSLQEFVSVITTTPEGRAVPGRRPCGRGRALAHRFFDQCRVLSPARGSRGRFHHRHHHLGARRRDESRADAGLGDLRRGAAHRGGCPDVPRAHCHSAVLGHTTWHLFRRVVEPLPAAGGETL